MASQPLRGRKVAILLAPAGSEQVEFTEPKKAVKDAGADVDVIGAEPGEARTYNHDLEPGETFTVDKTFDQVSADDYEALIVPGGTVGADKLRGNADAVRLIRGFFQAWQAGRGDLPRPVDAGGGRRGPRPHPDLLAHPGHRHPERGGHLGRPGSGDRPGPGHQPQPPRPARLLRQDRRSVRRRQGPGGLPR